MHKENFPGSPILIVDDDKNFLNSMDFKLRSNGITNIECCQDSLEVMNRLKSKKYSTILLDLKMPGISGMDLLPKIVAEYPDIPVIVVTGFPEIETTTHCMKIGAFDYIVKTDDPQKLIETIRNALNLMDVHKEIIISKKGLFSGLTRKYENFSNIITRSEKMYTIFETIGVIAVTPRPVLICGETGVGKELIARAIHKHSRRKGNFVAVNTAGKDDQLFSDDLFGHIKGAFTDAHRDRKGLVEMAEEGTLFLDEIGEVSPSSQVKLLRLLQEGEYFRLGEDKPRYSNARIVTATNKNLNDLKETGEFREDLYYRLQIHDIYIPPLRKRKEDIEPLLKHFIKKSAEELKKPPPSYPNELLTLLQSYHFPGNIRELESMVYAAVTRHKKGILSLDVFWEKIKNSDQNVSEGSKITFSETLPTLGELEEIYLKELMRRSKGNITIGAKLAGLQRKTLAYRLKRLEKMRD